MLKLLGAVLVIGGGAWLGLSAARELSRRVKALEAWRDALGLLASELAFRLPAMPVLTERLSHSAREPARVVFAQLGGELDRLGEHSFEELWREALTAHAGGLDGEELEVLQGLGMVLGRYGWEEQCKGLESARRTLDELAHQAREELRQKGKAYAALGVSLGAFLTIILL